MNNNLKRKKQRNFLRSYKFVAKQKKPLAIIICGCLIATAISVLFPFQTEKIISSFTTGDIAQLLKSALILLALEVAHSSIHMLCWGLNSGKLTSAVSRDMRYQLIGKTMNLKEINFDKDNNGKILQTINNDVETLSSIYVNLIDVSITIISKLVIFVYIFVANAYLGLFCILELLIIWLATKLRVNYRYKGKKKVSEVNDKITNFSSEIVHASQDIKSYNIQDSLLATMDGQLKKQEALSKDYKKKDYMLKRTNTIIRAVLNCLYIVLSVILFKADIVGLSVAFTIFVFRQDLSSVVDWLTESVEIIKDGEFYATRIYDLLDGFNYGEESLEGLQIELKNCNIKTNNLTFSYNESKPVLDNITIDTQNYKKVAFVGESGCGKSTFIKLLNKLYSLPRDMLYIDGIDICDISNKSLRDAITVISQNPYIFNL